MCEFFLSECILWLKKRREDSGKAMKFICELCGYVYDEECGDEENGIDPGTEFDELPRNWVCPMCAADKDDFEAVEEV